MNRPDKRGILYVIPSPLGTDGLYTLPDYVLEQLPTLRHFFVESEKESRRFLVKAFKLLEDTDSLNRVSDIHWINITQLDSKASNKVLFGPIDRGMDMGLLSDVGCPAIADPGAAIVNKAHEYGIVVKPLVGPSSIFLSLMASGLGGQKFSFCGYLPRDSPNRIKAIEKLQTRSVQEMETQIFIETPYRNLQLFGDLISTLDSETQLCVAIDLTLLSEEIHSMPIRFWRTYSTPAMHKRPAVFLMSTGTSR